MSREQMIHIRDLSVRYCTTEETVEALHSVTLTVEAGEFVTVVGPSGCGKSTLLNVIAGLLVPGGGVQIAGEILLDDTPFHQHIGRNISLGYVFQKDALLPWRTVRQNVEVGLEIRGIPREERRQRTDRFIEMVGLSDFANHLPHQLSGGMRQRVSIIRTLVYNPDVILMDEPFGALDAQTKLFLADELLRIWQEMHKTIILVTHDLEEAITLSNRVFLMTARPGTMKKEYKIEIPYPRSAFTIRFTEHFSHLYRFLWDDLRDEVLRQGGALTTWKERFSGNGFC
jgi:NitT/TauT family transport system ATP-binding protein